MRSKIQQFNYWVDTTFVPVNYVLLIVCTVTTIVYAVDNNYSWPFWGTLLVGVWSLVDVVTWHRRKRRTKLSAE